MIYTDSQRRALEHRDGNLLIIACAGSGKTQVLSRRIALLVSEGIQRESIVAFTFTDMAASELKSRIRKEMSILRAEGRLQDASLGDMYVGTIHSFSLQLLKEISATYRNYEIIDDKKQASIIVSNYNRFGLRTLENGNSRIETIRRFIETLNIIYKESIDIDSLSNSNLRDSVRAYCDYIKDRPNYYLTFDEIISELTTIMQQNPAIRDSVQEKFTNVFVDEYQDVDDRQEILIRLLSGDGVTANICAVGDDDQAIYRFRGATVTNILSFENRYPNVLRVVLSSNFRSSHAIAEIANTAVSGRREGRRTISGLSRRLTKTMEAMHFNHQTGAFVETMASHGDVWNCTFSSEENEAVFVANKIQELVGLPWNDEEAQRGLSFADMAILCRSVNYCRPIMDELDRRQIRYVIKGAKGLFESNEIQVVHAAFCMICDGQYVIPDPNNYDRYIFYDEIQTRETIRRNVAILSSTGKMPEADSNELFAWISRKKLLFQQMENREERARRHLGRRIYPQDVFYELLDVLGSSRHIWDDVVLYNLGRFSELILDFESVHQWVTPYDLRNFVYFLGYWASKEANDIKHQDFGGQNAVQISTIHQAKGLEWPVVFIPTLTSRRMPSQRRNTGNAHLMEPGECTGRPSATHDPVEAQERFDEELRLWYVALTRSKKFLFISGIECPRTHTSQFASNIRHDYVCTNPDSVFERPDRLEPQVPINAAIIPTNFSDLKYFWECPRDYQLRRLMGFSPGVNESYGYGQQIHNLLALIHENIRFAQVDDAWIEARVDEHFNLRYTRGEPLEIMKAAAKRILINYLHHDTDLGLKVLHSEKAFEFIVGDAMISGTIDLLNRVGAPAVADDRSVEIVDFKTGKTGEDLAADERVASVSQQLQLYSIATLDALGLQPQQATAHFLYASGQHNKLNIPVNEALMLEMKQQIADTVCNIKSGSFPMCEYNQHKCGNCDYKRICIGSRRGDAAI